MNLTWGEKKQLIGIVGVVLQLQKRRQNAALMAAVLSSSVNVDAVDYVSSSPSRVRSWFQFGDELCADAVRVLWGQKGNTALHYVCQRKNQSLVPLLLEKNSDINIRNSVRIRSQRTPNTSGWLWPPVLLPSGWRNSVRHRNQIEVQQDSQPAEEGKVEADGRKTETILFSWLAFYATSTDGGKSWFWRFKIGHEVSNEFDQLTYLCRRDLRVR